MIPLLKHGFSFESKIAHHFLKRWKLLPWKTNQLISKHKTLTKEKPYSVQLATFPGHKYEVTISLRSHSNKVSAKGSLLKVKFLTKEHSSIPLKKSANLSYSEATGLYKYLEVSPNEHSHVFNIHTPENAKYIVVTLTPYRDVQSILVSKFLIKKKYSILQPTEGQYTKLNTDIGSSSMSQPKSKTLAQIEYHAQLDKNTSSPHLAHPLNLPLTKKISNTSEDWLDLKSNRSIILKKDSAKEIIIQLKSNHSFNYSISLQDIEGKELETHTHKTPLPGKDLFVVFRIVFTPQSHCAIVNFQADDQYSARLQNTINYNILKEGISVVIPSYKGQDSILRCINSLRAQSYSNFEIILVLNGEKDETEKLITNIEDSRIRIVHSDQGAGKARNLGIKLASYSFITFIDDDDFVSDHYLFSLLAKATPNSISLAFIKDEHDTEERITVYPKINKQLENKNSLSYHEAHSFMTMNACKSIPTFFAKQVSYNETLKSGEDVCYFTKLLTKFNFIIIPPTQNFSPFYHRVLRKDSVSRQQESYDFNVSQRLDCIEALEDILAASPTDKHFFVKSKIDAQGQFINRYLQKHPSDISKAKTDALNRTLIHFEYQEHIPVKTDTIVVSYCFAPFIDTSAVVMLKRIRERNYHSDVISNNMSSVRQSDPYLKLLASGYIASNTILNTPTSFSNFDSLAQFSNKALDKYLSLVDQGNVYKNIYSRALWPASHFGAATIKAINPKLIWVAEFSDPVLFDISSNKRYSQIDQEWLEGLPLESYCKELDINLPEDDNVFFWVEFIPYIMADELVFTNNLQMEYMLSYIENKALRDHIKTKSTIAPQPTLSRKFYTQSSYNYPLKQDTINIGYFGSFYKNRGLNDAVKALAEVNSESSSNIHLHVFTASKDLNNIEASLEHTTINPYLNYFDFLKVCDEMDVLLVSDTNTKEWKDINPYLPSKVSDYAGSTAHVWAITESGSTLSQYKNIKYTSNVDSLKSLKNALIHIVADSPKNSLK